MSLLFTGQEGGDIFWVDSWQLSGLFRTRNHLSDSFDTSWKAPLSYSNGSVVYDPSVGNTIGVTNPAAIIENGNRNTPSDRQVFDGSFLRLKNINLGYNFNFKNGNSLRLYISGQNLLTWTKYPDMILKFELIQEILKNVVLILEVIQGQNHIFLD